MFIGGGGGGGEPARPPVPRTPSPEVHRREVAAAPAERSPSSGDLQVRREAKPDLERSWQAVRGRQARCSGESSATSAGETSEMRIFGVLGSWRRLHGSWCGIPCLRRTVAVVGGVVGRIGVPADELYY